jgi:hypothetical protein
VEGEGCRIRDEECMVKGEGERCRVKGVGSGTKGVGRKV